MVSKPTPSVRRGPPKAVQALHSAATGGSSPYDQSAPPNCHDCSTVRILIRMTTPVPTRFSDEELALIDNLVDLGVGDSRSAVIRHAIHQLADLVRRAQVGADIAASYREYPQTPEDDDLAMANAIAMTKAEPW